MDISSLLKSLGRKPVNRQSPHHSTADKRPRRQKKAEKRERVRRRSYLHTLSRTQLEALAKEANIRGRSKMTKVELVRALV